jgi:hypothetical protein
MLSSEGLDHIFEGLSRDLRVSDGEIIEIVYN